MNRSITSFFNKLRLGDEISYENLTVFPILSYSSEKYNFLTVDEALDNKFVRITETSDIGDVPSLKLMNNSNNKIFILDGEEFLGSKQNRATNTVVLVDEKGELTIPVSCVERNRWMYKSDSFSSGNTRTYYKLRKKMFLLGVSNKQRKIKIHPQHDIWDDIDKKMNKMNVSSSTNAMNDIYKKYSSRLNQYLSNMTMKKDQVGMVVIINNKVVGCEIFADGDMLGNLYDKMLKSYAIDAIEEAKTDLKVQKTLRRKALKFLNDVRKTNIDFSESVGIGVNLHLDSQDVIGSALDFNNGIVYLSAYNKSVQ